MRWLLNKQWDKFFYIMIGFAVLLLVGILTSSLLATDISLIHRWYPWLETTFFILLIFLWILVTKYLLNIIFFRYEGEFLINLNIITFTITATNLALVAFHNIFLVPNNLIFTQPLDGFFYLNRIFLSNLSRMVVFNVDASLFLTANNALIYFMLIVHLFGFYLSLSYTAINLLFRNFQRKLINFIRFIFINQNATIYYIFTDFDRQEIVSLLDKFKDREFVKVVLTQNEQSTQLGQELRKIITLNSVEVVTASLTSSSIEAIISRYHSKKRILISFYKEDQMNVQFAEAALNSIQSLHQKEIKAFDEIKILMEGNESLQQTIRRIKTHGNTSVYDYKNRFQFSMINHDETQIDFYPREFNSFWYLGFVNTTQENNVNINTITFESSMKGSKLKAKISFSNGSEKLVDLPKNTLITHIKNLREKINQTQFFVNVRNSSFENYLKFEEKSYGSIRFFNEYRSISNQFVFKNSLYDILGPEKMAKKNKINIRLLGFGRMNQAILDRILPAYQGPEENELSVVPINFDKENLKYKVKYDSKILAKALRNDLKTGKDDYFEDFHLYQMNEELEFDLSNTNLLNKFLTEDFKSLHHPYLESDANLFMIACGNDSFFNLHIAFQLQATLAKLFDAMDESKADPKKVNVPKKAYIFVYLRQRQWYEENKYQHIFKSIQEANQNEVAIPIISFGENTLFNLFSEHREEHFTELARHQNFIYSTKNGDLLFHGLYNQPEIKIQAAQHEESTKRFEALIPSIEELAFFYNSIARSASLIQEYSFYYWWGKNTSYNDRLSSYEAALNLRQKLNLMGFDLHYQEPKVLSSKIQLSSENNHQQDIKAYFTTLRKIAKEKDILTLLQRMEHNRWTAYKMLMGDLPFAKPKIKVNLDDTIKYRNAAKTLTACLTTNAGLAEFKDYVLDLVKKDSSKSDLSLKKVERKLDEIIFLNDIDTLVYLHILLVGTKFEIKKFPENQPKESSDVLK